MVENGLRAQLVANKILILEFGNLSLRANLHISLENELVTPVKKDISFPIQELANIFTGRVIKLEAHFTEIRLVFDIYLNDTSKARLTHFMSLVSFYTP